MAAENSFDIYCEVDLAEVKNAIQQAMKEIVTRFDLKGTASSISLAEEGIVLESSEDYPCRTIGDLLRAKLVKRGVAVKAVTFGEIKPAAGGRVRQVATLQKGIPQEVSKEIVALIKRSKMKVQASIQADQVRVSGKNRDDLQEVIQLVKSQEFPVHIQFGNYRST